MNWQDARVMGGPGGYLYAHEDRWGNVVLTRACIAMNGELQASIVHLRHEDADELERYLRVIRERDGRQP